LESKVGLGFGILIFFATGLPGLMLSSLRLELVGDVMCGGSFVDGLRFLSGFNFLISFATRLPGLMLSSLRLEASLVVERKFIVANDEEEATTGPGRSRGRSGDCEDLFREY
jgi:hypothetical protein